jgi:hypothetical protein
MPLFSRQFSFPRECTHFPIDPVSYHAKELGLSLLVWEILCVVWILWVSERKLWRVFGCCGGYFLPAFLPV